MAAARIFSLILVLIYEDKVSITRFIVAYRKHHSLAWRRLLDA
jgi:hypothetical protein